MAKLTRVTGKLFGETATSTGQDPQIGQFGSAKNGTYVGTGDIATIQNLSAWSVGWADAVTPTQQFPTLPEMTGVHKVLSYQQNYLLQQGVAEWDSATTYYTNSFCSVNGTLFVSNSDDNINNNPASDSINWTEYSRSGAYIGQTVFSLDPLVESDLHLLDGTVLPASGIYQDFIDRHIVPLFQNYPQRFCTEAEWQQAVSTYGVCGKYVYNAGVSVRLPKVTGHVEGTLDTNALGDLVEAGLPNITGTGKGTGVAGDYTGALKYTGGSTGTIGGHNNTNSLNYDFDASLSNPIYGNSDTVQTQSILGYMYIVVATGAKTAVDLEIDNIVTDLNNKVDISNMVEVPTIIEISDPSLMPSWYRVYSDGWCEQGGINIGNDAWGLATVTLLKPYKDNNYTISIGSETQTNSDFTNANSTSIRAVTMAQYINKTTASFGIQTKYNVDWVAKGYIR